MCCSSFNGIMMDLSGNVAYLTRFPLPTTFSITTITTYRYYSTALAMRIESTLIKVSLLVLILSSNPVFVKFGPNAQVIFVSGGIRPKPGFGFCKACKFESYPASSRCSSASRTFILVRVASSEAECEGASKSLASICRYPLTGFSQQSFT
jgi:hypothetical protein